MRRLFDNSESSTKGISNKTVERSKNLIAMKINEDTFAVGSSSEPSKGYLVVKNRSDWHCSCKGFIFRAECAHTVKVQEVCNKKKDNK